ncbi:MAG: GumC family protein [Geminicoccaceae bacterium]
MTVGTYPAANESFKPGTYAPVAEDRLDFRHLLVVLRRRRTMIVWTVALLTALSAVIAFSLTPRYTGMSQVLIQPRETRVVETQTVWDDAPQDKATIETELKMLESRTFVRSLIKQMGLLSDPEFNGSAAQAASPVRMVKQLLGGLLRPTTWLPSAWASAIGLGHQDDALSINPDDPMERATDAVLARLSASQAGESYVLSIRFTSTDPAKSAAIANKVAEFYVEDNLEARQDAIDRAADWLSGRVNQLRDRLIASEGAIAAYRAENQLIDNGGVGLDDQQIGALNHELIIARADRTAKEARLSLVRKLRSRGGTLESVGELMASPVIADLRRQQTELLRQEAQYAQEFGPNHPKTVQLYAEKEKLAARVDQELLNIIGGLENEVSIARIRERTIEENLGQARGQIAVNHQAEVQLRELEREAEANRLLYTTFLNRLKELGEQKDLVQSGARVISTSSVPTVPSSPAPPMIIVAGFVGSCMLGTVLALVREGLESGLRHSQQVERLLGVPSLGLVPKLPRLGKERVHEYLLRRTQSAYAEAVRGVQLALYLSRIDHAPQVILVTSSLPGEGKTTLAMSLAASLAGAGHRTVLVDLDLRRPTVRRRMGLPEEAPGLVEFMLGESTLDQIILTEPTEANLDLITVRRLPASPTDLLTSHKMLAFLRELRGSYKFVVLDSAPLLGITDTRIAALHADAVLMAVQWGKTKEEVAVNGLKALQESRAKIAGAVLTQVNLRRHARLAYGDGVQCYGKYQQYYIN